MTTPTFDMRGGNGPTRVMAIERMSWFLIARLIDSTAGLKRSTWPTISVTPARCAAATMARPSSTVGAIGFSTMTWTPRGNTGEREIVVQMGRRGNGHGVNTAGQQRFESSNSAQPSIAGDKLALLAVGIDNPDQFNAGHLRQDARMVAAHDADADHTDFQRNTPTHPASFRHNPKGSPQR